MYISKIRTTNTSANLSQIKPKDGRNVVGRVSDVTGGRRSFANPTATKPVEDLRGVAHQAFGKGRIFTVV